ncbi:acyl-CoA carboxylase biotin carboxyl carrier protein subunit [Pedobacter sp. PWIIR3]
MKAKVNGRYAHEIEADNAVLSIDGQEITIDYIQLQGQHANILYKDRSYNIEFISTERSGKLCSIKVNGNTYTVELQDKYDLLLQQLGMDSLQSVKVKDVKAPMPGLVLNIFAEAGAEVKKGDNLLVLEAMKMENMIKSPADGQIKSVLIEKGSKVEKNQVLVQFS